MNDPRPIGVFDSGMGGLTVLAELVKALPGEDFIYLGDTARIPYGANSPRTVLRFSREDAAFLLKHDIKLIIIACNTSAAHAESTLADELPVPVLGVIKPGVEALLTRTRNRRVGVLGTRSTIKSGAYEKEILSRDAGLTVFSRPCPLFVSLVEEGWIDKKVTSLVIQEYLAEIEREDVDAAILGCTHYPLLKEAIRREYPNLTLIDSSQEVARAAKERLTELNLHAGRADGGSVQIFLTDMSEQIESLTRLFYGSPFQSISEVNLND